jgi:hypothetical protein
MTRQELTDFLAERERASQENALDRWRREVREREAEHARERAQSRERRRLDTAPVDWHAAIEAAITDEREYTEQLLVELVAAVQSQANDDLERAVRSLTIELGELRATLAELRAAVAIERVERTGKADVLDLPALPRARDLN